MRKNYLKLIIAAFVSSTIFFSIHSCEKEEENIKTYTPTGIAIDPNNFKGEVKNGEIVTLNPHQVYMMNGAIKISNGGKLVIPAGTKIIATGGADSHVLVEQGGQIFANGTSGSPVVFTSETKTDGSWGGIIISGKAPINNGSSAISEIGNMTYGGNEIEDNSGVLNYVRIEFAGADLGTKKFNALSLFGVGSSTRIESIAVLHSDDDAIEIFGGTVNISNIVSLENASNAINFKDGWTGNITNIFTKRKQDGTGNNAIKGINNVSNFNASPRSKTFIKNATLIGGNDTGESNGIWLSSGAFATIENAVLASWDTGIKLESDSTVAHFNGKEKISEISFHSSNIINKVTATSTAGNPITILDDTFTENTSATGAGNAENLPTWAIGWSEL